MQAWFDDSGTKMVGRWMSVAGLFGDAELFKVLSDQWDRHLRAMHPGQIQYFKMDEACGLEEQFNFWEPANRDAKVRQMAQVIDREDLLVIAARLDLQAFETVGQRWSHVRPKKGDLVRYHSMVQPYILLFQHVLVTAVTEAVNRGETRPIEVIFDNQDRLRQSILNMYPELRELERDHPERFAVMPVQPWFRDDIDWVMLQAADLIAGDIRLVAEANQNNPPFIGNLFSRLKMSRYCEDISEQRMEELHSHLVVSLEREERETEQRHREDGCGD